MKEELKSKIKEIVKTIKSEHNIELEIDLPVDKSSKIFAISGNVKMNKKLLILILFLLISILPTIANPNWVQVDDKSYIDTNSLKNEIYQNSNYGNYYSLWVKSLNNGSKTFLKLEKYYNSKIWYELAQVYIDCYNKRIAWKSYIEYDLQSEVIEMKTLHDYEVEFNSIAPGTNAEFMYNYACTGKF